MKLYAIGDRVAHTQYGDGTVSRADTHHTKIEFDEHGPRTFVSSLVTLTPSDTLAPVKAAARRKRAPRAVAAAQP